MRSSRPVPALTALLVGAALALTGCSSSDPADGATHATSSAGDTGSATRVVHTDQGDVTVPAAPQRVVVLNYALAGYLYDLDVPVAATTSEDFDHKAELSPRWGDKPEKDGTQLLTWGMDGFDYEAILQLEPDLIVAGGVGLPNALAVKAYDRLSTIAPTVVVSNTLTTWQDQLSFVAGDVLGRSADYDRLRATYDDRVADVKKAIPLPPTPVATVTVTADGTPYLLFDDGGLPEALAEVGLEPAPLAEEFGLEPYTKGGDMAELSTEQVGKVLAKVPTVFVTGFNADTADVASLSSKPVWAALPSFSGKHAYDLPYWTVRGDYDEALALLDEIQKQFS
jgi:iron complex transport system substrate-binding protein